MTNEAPKLLPCPFCGCEAAEPWFDDSEDNEFGEVYCTKCSASTRGSHQDWMRNETDISRSISEAIAAWNARDTTHAQAMVAAAYERCAQYVDAGEYMGSDGKGTPKSRPMTGDAIRARTPDDAQAALDALLRAERVKALREAADCIGHITQAEDRDAILALIEKETGQ